MKILPIEQYRDPLVIKWYTDELDRKISVERLNEEYTIVNGQILLTEIPDEKYGVTINGMKEIRNNKILEENEYKVNYTQGVIRFNESQEAKTKAITFYSRGIIYYPASRIYTSAQEGEVQETLQSILDTQVKKFIFSTESPSDEDADLYPEGSVWFVYRDD